MKIQMMALGKLVPYARNPRINGPAIDKVAASIKEFGFRQPIVVDSEMVIIAGHTRYVASQKLGLEKVPVHVAEGLTPQQIKAYRIADNRLAADAQWDRELLSLEIEELEKADFDQALLGFEPNELEQLNKDMANLEDGFDSDSEKEVEAADTRATIGPYTFMIERAEYLEWMEEIKQRVGFDKEAVTKELKRKLGL